MACRKVAICSQEPDRANGSKKKSNPARTLERASDSPSFSSPGPPGSPSDFELIRRIWIRVFETPSPDAAADLRFSAVRATPRLMEPIWSIETSGFYGRRGLQLPQMSARANRGNLIAHLPHQLSLPNPPRKNGRTGAKPKFAHRGRRGNSAHRHRKSGSAAIRHR